LCHVNKLFNRAAYSYRNKHQRFTFGDTANEKVKKTQAIIKDLLNDPTKSSVLDAIRTISIEVHEIKDWNRNKASTNYSGWDDLVDLLIRLPYLKALTVAGDGQIPKIVFETIEHYHKTAYLDILDWCRLEDGQDHNNPDEIALAKSPNLRSIQARLWNTNADYDLRFAALKRIVTMAPNIQDVDISQGSSGCVVRGYSMEQLQEERRRAALFDVEASPKSIKSLKSEGGSFVDSLGIAVDCTKLESLDIDYIPDEDFFTRDCLPNSRFPNLKHFSTSIDLYNRDAIKLAVLKLAVSGYIASAKPLQTLSLKNWRKDIPLSTILSAHGKTVQTLALHETENINEPQGLLSLTELDQIAQCCPFLEDLTLDVGDRGLDHMLAMISALAKLPKLSVLRIYIPLGIAGEAAQTPWGLLEKEKSSLDVGSHKRNPLSPLDDACWLENFWSILRTEKLRYRTPALQEFHVKIGEWESKMGQGFPAPWVIWESSNRRYLIAKPSERDDTPDELSVQEMKSIPYGKLGSVETKVIPQIVTGI